MKTFKHRKTGEMATYQDGILKSSGFCVEIGTEPSSEFWERVDEFPVGTKVRDTNPDTEGYTYTKLNNGLWKMGWIDNFAILESTIGKGKRFEVIEESNRPVIITTEDGFKLRDYDKWYPVCIEDGLGFIPFSIINQKWSGKPPKGFKAFSLKESAEEYILVNKPCLSLKDINDSWVLKDVFREGKHVHGSKTLAKLKELVKSRI